MKRATEHPPTAPKASAMKAGPAAPLTAIALAVAVLAASPQQSRAASECGPDLPGQDSVTCTGANYGTGIIYPASTGLTVNLDNPAMAVQASAGGAAVYLPGAGGNTGALTIHVRNVGSVTGIGRQAVAVATPGNGPGTIRIDNGVFTSDFTSVVSAITTAGSGAVLIRLDGGRVTNTSNLSGAYAVFASALGTATGGAAVEMNGGVVESLGTLGGVGLRAQAGNAMAAIRMNGGSVSAGTFGLHAAALGTAQAMVSMTGGSVQTDRGGATSILALTSNAGSAASNQVRISGGTVTALGASSEAIRSETYGSGLASVDMSGGTVSALANNADGIFVRSRLGDYVANITGGTVNGGAGQGAAIRTAASAGRGGTLNIGAAAVINAGASGIAIRDGDVNRDGVEDAGGQANSVITTAGTINGSVVLGAGTDALTVAGGTVNGNITGDGPDTLRFDLGAGAFTYAAPHAITGMDAVSLTSGSLRLDGSATTNNFAVLGGTLSGSGSVTGPLAVNSGGTLAAGNGTGALTASGDLSFAPGSTYLVQFNAAGAPSAVSAVKAGTLTISGGQVRVGAGGGGFTRNTPYTILSASGARTGTFDGVSTDLALLTPTLAYEPNAVVLTMVPTPGAYEEVGETPNEKAVGGHLGSFADSPGAAAELIQQIEGLSAPEARRAFASLAGAQHASASQVASAAGRNFSSILSARSGFSTSGLQQSRAPGLAQYAGLNPVHLGVVAQASDAGPGAAAQRTRDLDEAVLQARPSGSLWLQPIRAGGDIGGDVNSPALDYTANGFAIGYDRPVDERWLVGAAFGYQRSEWDAGIPSLTTSPASGKLHTAQAGLYASYKGEAWRVRGDLTLDLHDFDTERTVNIGGASSVASSSHRGRELGASVQAEYPIAWGTWQVRPLIGARYAHQHESGFDESGPSVGNLSVGRRSAQSLNASAGARFLRPLNDGRGALELRVVASHLFGDEENKVRARVLGQAGGFKASGSPLKRDALTLGASVTGQWTRTLWGFADAAYEYRGSGQDAYQLTVGLRKFF